MQQDGTALEHRDHFAVGVVVDDRGHAVVRADRQEFRLELMPLPMFTGTTR